MSCPGCRIRAISKSNNLKCSPALNSLRYIRILDMFFQSTKPRWHRKAFIYYASLLEPRSPRSKLQHVHDTSEVAEERRLEPKGPSIFQSSLGADPGYLCHTLLFFILFILFPFSSFHIVVLDSGPSFL